MRKKPEQESLFSSVGGNKLNSLKRTAFVLSSNWSIGGLFSRGALLCSSLGEISGSPFFDEVHADRLLVSFGGVPLEWSEGVRASTKNSFPIAIRLKKDSGVKFELRGVSRGLSLDDVDCLVFKSDKEADFFVSQGFGDWDLDAFNIPTETNADIFGAKTSVIAEFADKKPKVDAPNDLVTLRIADGKAGMLAIMPHVIQGKRSWMSVYEQAWTDEISVKSKEAEWTSAILSGLGQNKDPKEKSLELALLAATSHVIVHEYGPKVGWPATEILERIVEEAKLRCTKEAVAAESELMESWTQRCRDILSARKDPPSLMDVGNLPYRAVLLLLMREDVATIISGSEDSGVLRIGQNIRSLAAMLASLRVGLRSLSVDFKSSIEGGDSRAWLGLLGSKVLEDIGIGNERKTKDPVRARVKYRSIGVLQGEWVIRDGKTELFRKTRNVDPDLVRVHAMGLGLGYTFDELDDDALKSSINWENGRSQPVYIELMRSLEKNNRFIRFWSPALSVAPARKTKNAAWPSAKLKGLKIAGLVDLLERNARDGMKCRFAVDREKQAVIVVVDQILATLDEQEFQQHLEHVAKVADDYEKQQGLDDFR